MSQTKQNLRPTEIIVTNMSCDELFVAIQRTHQDKQEAIALILKEKPMKIVAFLQSPSQTIFPEDTPAHILDKYRDDQEYHRRMLKQSMTGNRLYQAFGPLYDEIVWDNVAPKDEVDHAHIDRVIAESEPELILTFGEVAKEAVSNSIMAIKIKTMACHHPNARFRTQNDLDEFAVQVREHILTHEREEN